MREVRTLVASAAAAAAVVAISCGGRPSSTTSPTGPCPSSSPTTIVISNNQLCPQTLTVARGTQITMMNSDSHVHEMDSDPHPEHTDCPELNQIGFLRQSASRHRARDGRPPGIEGLR